MPYRSAIALVVSLLMPRKYEATVLLAIQPGSGPASPAAMSPAYLDSLRSYEQLVSSDGLLERLLRETGLGAQPAPGRIRVSRA